MYIIIAGGGIIGGELARTLLAHRHDVVVIDPDPDVCKRLYAETGIMAIRGSAGSIDLLKEAGIDKADVVVAATPHDIENLSCAILAKSLKVPVVISRMRDANYENAYKVAGVDRIVRVADLMVNQIIMDIENPLVRRVAIIAGGRATVFTVTVPEDADVDHCALKDIALRPHFPGQCTIAGIYRASESRFMVPRGEEVLYAGDEIYIVCPPRDINEVVSHLTAKAAKSVVMATT